MARQKNAADTVSKSGSNGGRGGYAQIEFINVNLTDAQKSAYAKWEGGNPDILQIEDDVLAGGYKLSCSFDDKSLSYLCSLTNRNGDPSFVNKCYTLRARTAWQARARVLWLHSVHCGGDWREFADPDIDSDLW